MLLFAELRRIAIERRVTHLVQDIEARFRSVLRAWNGDMDRIGMPGEYLRKEWGLRPREPLVKSASAALAP